jgi:hypothetical protein
VEQPNAHRRIHVGFSGETSVSAKRGPGRADSWEVAMRSVRRLLIATLAVAASGLGVADPSRAQSDTVTVVGTFTDEGVECPAIRGDDGVLYTLVPKSSVGLVSPGARVRVEGTVQEFSTCQQGTTIAVTSVEQAK